MNKIFSEPFLRTLFVSQNKWHKHSVLVHTLKVAYGTIKFKQYKMLLAALLHDIGKPFVAYKDADDLEKDYESYSFTNHEEASYRIIRNWPVSDYTKNLVRYHYIIRDMKNCKKKGKFARYNRLYKIFEKLDKAFIEELHDFMLIDDYGKE